MLASAVLLPLLGLTWAFGVLSVNENTIVFAWLFTIFNSFQVYTYCLQLMHCASAQKYYIVIIQCNPVCVNLICREFSSSSFMSFEVKWYVNTVHTQFDQHLGSTQ
jgi:hypothetical protein